MGLLSGIGWSWSMGGSGLVEMEALEVVGGGFGGLVAGGGQQMVEGLGGEVRLDMQNRGGEEYQTDVTVRGGIFEGTGMAVGGMVLLDPQTGHYSGEIPLDPGSFGYAELWLGTEHAQRSFNATAGTVNWVWRAIETETELEIIQGSQGRWGGRLRTARELGAGGVEFALSSQKGEGSVEGGDFEMVRASFRVEGAAGDVRGRVFGGWVDKFYGWPGMYTGFANLRETDDYQVGLLGFQVETGEGKLGRHWFGGYWRQLDDDYEFNRFSPGNGFEHLTRVSSLQGEGRWRTDRWQGEYRWVWVSDELVRSTSLTEGTFNSRQFGSGSFRMGRILSAGRQSELILRGGWGLDFSEWESTIGRPFVGIEWKRSGRHGLHEIRWEAGRTSQVPGYTVLKSAPSGLFGGNADLGRETANSMELGYGWTSERVQLGSVVFVRQDRGLIDWVFDSEEATARQAAALDSETVGLEWNIRWNRESGFLEIAYGYLDKEADYREEGVDASFYALNYARHRAILISDNALGGGFRMRGELEWREQAHNPLRAGSRAATFVNLELRWSPVEAPWMDWSVRIENLAKENFEELPGAPAPGREGKVVLALRF